MNAKEARNNSKNNNDLIINEHLEKIGKLIKLASDNGELHISYNYGSKLSYDNLQTIINKLKNLGYNAENENDNDKYYHSTYFLRIDW